MTLELISFGLGANWIAKLFKKLRRTQKKRQKELNEVNDALGMNPLELAKFYVDPDCQEVNPADSYEEDFLVTSNLILIKIDEFFRAKKFDRAGYSQMFILSDAGMGKTSLLVMLKMLHLSSFWPKNTDCVVKKLGKDSIKEINEIENKMKTILLLDSLDEDSTAYGRVEERLIEILDATKKFHKVIITCRTQFFPKADKDQLERPGRIKIGGYLCPSKYLSFFNDKKVDAYLDKLFPRKWLFFKQKKKIKEAKELIKSMGALRCRPMLLSLIDDLKESELIQNKMNEYGIYDALVDYWLSREQAKTKIPRKELLKACEILAIELQKNEIRSIPEKELDFKIAALSDLKKVKAIDIKGRSLLNKNSEGDYRFSHYSIQEFLVVKRFVENPDLRVEKKIHHSDFILQLLLDKCKEDSKHKDYIFKNFSFIRANLSRANLSGADLSGATLSETDLFGAELSGANLSGATLSEIDLSGATLSETDLFGAELSVANLSGADLSGANLLRADLREATLSGADLRGANLEGAKLLEANLEGADLSGANLTGANLTGAKLLEANLLKANLLKADLTGAKLEGAKLEGAKLSRADLSGADLSGADLSGANLREGNLTGAKLLGAKLEGAKLLRADLRQADLRVADLAGANLREGNLTGAKLLGANLWGADLWGGDLRQANLREANLTGANLLKADLAVANLAGADLAGANLFGADLEGANLEGATGLTEEQLLHVLSLHKVEGLDPKLEANLKKKRPELFKKSKN